MISAEAPNAASGSPPPEGLAMQLPAKTRHVLQRYGLAVVLASLALFIRGMLPFPEGASIYQLPVAAIVISAWYGGRRPGLVATLICTLGSWYWFIPPVHSFKLASDHVLPFSIFIALCVLLTEFGANVRRTQGALSESEQRLRVMAETLQEILWFESITPQRILYVSPRYEQIWGRPVTELECDPEAWMESVHLDDRQNASTVRRRWLAGEGTDRLDVTFRIVRPDGETRWIHSRGTLIRDERGKPYRASRISEDVSEEKLAQEALAEAQTQLAHVSRLTTIGELTTSIVHEVSQPLAAMIANAAASARWLAAQPPDIAEARAAVSNITADGKRARDVIARIRALAKHQVSHTEAVDINQEVLEVLGVTQHELRSHNIVRRTELARALPRVTGDRVQLQQVLLNLIMNAIEAMGAVDDRSRELTIATDEDSPNAIRVEVRDSGPGLDAQGAERMFDAFYTTKSDGLGMGLSISRSIVKAHGGRLWASPNEPHGAVFRFSLPLSGKALP